MKPSVQLVTVGLRTISLGVPVATYGSVAAASGHIGERNVVLVMADTADLGGAMTRLDAVRAHAAAGGHVVVVRATGFEEALTWDTPAASELALPAKLSDLAALIGLPDPEEDGPIAATVAEHEAGHPPVAAWKRGHLWFHPSSRQFLVSGAHVRFPVPLDSASPCDDPTCEHHEVEDRWTPRCPGGFSACIEKFQLADRWPHAHLLEVELSEGLALGGSPRSDLLHWCAGRQRLAAVELAGRCRECGSEASHLSGKDRGDAPTVLIERCLDHLVDHTLSVDEVARLLPGVELRRI